MKPIAFRIQDFKSISDTGVCHLSTDGITVLAGENESGKTAILSALRDFNLESGTAPKTSDFVPDDDFEKKPFVSICFEVEWEKLFYSLKDNSCFVLPAIQQELRFSNYLWVHRNLLDNTFSLDEPLTAFWGKEFGRIEAMPDEEYATFSAGLLPTESIAEDAVWIPQKTLRRHSTRNGLFLCISARLMTFCLEQLNSPCSDLRKRKQSGRRQQRFCLNKRRKLPMLHKLSKTF